MNINVQLPNQNMNKFKLVMAVQVVNIIETLKYNITYTKLTQSVTNYNKLYQN